MLHRERWLMRGHDVRGYEGQVEILKHRLGRAGAVVSLRIISLPDRRSIGPWSSYNDNKLSMLRMLQRAPSLASQVAAVLPREGPFLPGAVPVEN
jgi:hypothetical protein